LSYYADASIARQLVLVPARVYQVRHTLIQADLIAFEAPLYQVLALPNESVAPTPSAAGIQHLDELLRNLGARQ
jgi:hypothetical protein